MEQINMCPNTCQRQTDIRNSRIVECFRCSRLRRQFNLSIAHLVPLTTLLVTCSHLLATPLDAMQTKINTEELHSNQTAADSNVSLRQVLAPLLNAGHLNRMYYAPPKLESGWRAAAARAGSSAELKRSKWPASSEENGVTPLDLHSPNNRGPINLAATRPSQPRHEDDTPNYMSHHLSLKPQNLRFGQRRRDHDRVHREAQVDRRQDDESSSAASLIGNQFERRLLATGSSLPPTTASGGWSQPDPRRSYSAPVSKVKIVHVSSLRRNSAARRLYGGSARLNSRQRTSEPMNRKEDSLTEGPGLASTEASLSPASSTSSGSGNVSLEMTMGDFDELLDGADDSTQQQPDELNEIPLVAGDRKPAAINKRPTLAQTPPSQHSARLLTTTGTSQPLVTLIRYVPIIMNVPAEHLGAALATPTSTANIAPSKPQTPGAVAASNQQTGPAAANQQQDNLGRMILASSSDHHLQQQQQQQQQQQLASDVAAGTELAHISGLPSLSAAQIQQALSGATPAGPADLQQLAHGNQPVFARLAYIPLSQPSHTVGGHTMPPTMGASHMTSKALAAYASKLISMLKPSHLLSSLGNGGGGGGPSLPYLNYQHLQHAGHQQQGGGTQQIFLLAPSAETLLAGTSASHAHQVQPAPRPLRQTAGEPTVRPADLMINQASKVHSTKSQQQQQQRLRQKQQPPANQSKEQQLRWPLMPQMNGLVCVQGLIGAKQKQQQRDLPTQEQVDLNSFDDDYEPKKPTYAQQQQVAATKGQQRLPLPPRGKSSGGKESKFGKGPRAPGGKESPIRIMQQKMASKQQDGAEFQQQQDFYDFSQQKLVGSPTEPLRNIFEGGRDAQSTSRSFESSSSSRPQLSTRSHTAQPLAPPSPLPATATPPSAANYQPGDEIQSDARGRSIIPFTIRDKIDAPTNRVRTDREQHQAAGGGVSGASPNSSGTNNSPVQYDEPAEGEQPVSAGENVGGEQRRSRTTFVSASPATARGRVQGGGVDISYRTELGQRDYSLPVLMASSTPHRQRAPSSSSSSSLSLPNGLRPRGTLDRFDTPHQFSNPLTLANFAGHQYGPRAPAPPPRGLSLSLHEPMGASSSSSSVSTTTTTTLASLAGSAETTTTTTTSGDLAPITPTPTSPILTSLVPAGRPSTTASSDFETTARDESPGQLVSSVSPAGSGLPPRQVAVIPAITNERPPRQSANDTVELIINSSSSPSHEAPITASPLQFVSQQRQQGHLQQPGKGGGDIRMTPTGSQSSQLTSSPDDSTDSLMEMMSSNSFSHDRSLTPVERTVHSYGRISESLQTNPLDLIDLQNSRSSFELPAQLESLSMLHGDDENNNNNHGPPVTQKDKQQGERLHQDELESRPRVLQGALNVTAPALT